MEILGVFGCIVGMIGLISSQANYKKIIDIEKKLEKLESTHIEERIG